MEFTLKQIKRIHALDRAEIIELIGDIADSIRNMGSTYVFWNIGGETPFVLGAGGTSYALKELVVQEISPCGYIVANFNNEDIKMPIQHFSESLLRQLLTSYILMCEKHLTDYAFERLVKNTKKLQEILAD